MLPQFSKRQYYGDDGDYSDNWGYSSTALAIKWTFVGAIILFFLLWFIGGYYHAQRRLKRGQPPLLYHRFLVSRGQRMRYAPRPQYWNHAPQHEYYGHGYPMQTYAPPPPAYHAEHFPPPPAYQPPEGRSKVNPTQDFAPPAGPPPAHVGAAESSSAMQSVPLGQSSAGSGQVGGDSAVRVGPGRLSRFNPFK